MRSGVVAGRRKGARLLIHVLAIILRRIVAQLLSTELMWCYYTCLLTNHHLIELIPETKVLPAISPFCFVVHEIRHISAFTHRTSETRMQNNTHTSLQNTCFHWWWMLVFCFLLKSTTNKASIYHSLSLRYITHSRSTIKRRKERHASPEVDK